MDLTPKDIAALEEVIVRAVEDCAEIITLAASRAEIAPAHAAPTPAPIEPMPRPLTRAFTAGGGHSACEQVIREIVNHFPIYAKGAQGVFDALADRLDAALTHAGRLNEHNRDTGSENPATAVHQLVAYLKGLKPA